jgi:hypothetical protein
MNEPRLFIEFRPGMRSLIEDAIESLILLLDEIDGDADAEGEEDLKPDNDLEDGHDAEPYEDVGIGDAGDAFLMDQAYCCVPRDQRPRKQRTAAARLSKEENDPTLIPS